MKKILLLVAFFATIMAYAQDECATAVSLTPSTTCSPTSGALLNATTTSITTSCVGYYDVFYKFVANSPSATVTAVGSSGLDLRISAYAACGGTAIQCVDNNLNEGGTETMSLTSLIVGNTYYIKVQNWTLNTNTFGFTICVVSNPLAAPSNDECTGAISLTPAATCSPINGTILNATTSTITSSCAGYSDVFYKFVANAPTAVVTAVGSSDLNVKLSAFSACGATKVLPRLLQMMSAQVLLP